MTPSLEIAVAKPDDAAAFWQRYDRAWRSEAWAFKVVWHEQSHDISATVDGAVVGGLNVRIAASLAHVEALFVLPEHRAGGIGRALLVRCEELANYYNCHKVSAGRDERERRGPVFRGVRLSRRSDLAAAHVQARRRDAAQVPLVSHSLDPDDWDAFRAFAHRALDETLDAVAGIRERPPWRAIPPATRAAIVDDPLPRAPSDPAAVYAAFADWVAPYAVDNRHPRFFGWVHGAGTAEGIVRRCSPRE